MTGRLWLFVTLAVVAVVGAVGAGLWVLVETPFAPQRRFADGSVMTLAAVTHGKQHRFVRGTGWQRLLYSLLPPGQKHRSGASVITHTSKTDQAMVFWYVRRLKTAR